MGVRVAALAVPTLFVACIPAQPNRGLEHELRAARAEAAVEQRRVHELEARLARLEDRAAQQPPSSAPAGSDPAIQRQLDVLIAMNQQLLRETQAPRQEPALAVQSSAAPPTPTRALAPSALSPECNAGLTTEQKILQLVLELRGERSPWRVDGLSYEESQALRVLLRPERRLDRDNPWQ